MPFRLREIVSCEVYTRKAGFLELFTPLLNRLQWALRPPFVDTKPPTRERDNSGEM